MGPRSCCFPDGRFLQRKLGQAEVAWLGSCKGRVPMVITHQDCMGTNDAIEVESMSTCSA